MVASRPHPQFRLWEILILLSVGCSALSGCGVLANRNVEEQIEAEVAHIPIPRELDMTALPPYRVAAPDVLLIEAVNNIRPPSYALRAGDVVRIWLANPEPLEPIVPETPQEPGEPPPQSNPIETQFLLESEAQSKIVNGEYRVQADGTIDLGPVYGAVMIKGLTVDQAREAIKKQFQTYLRDDKGRTAGIKDPQVSVTMVEIAGNQAITGEHLVNPDGTVSLGIYGNVFVAGMTLPEVKNTLESHLSQYILEPELNVAVAAYNSKVYYIILDGGGFGEEVVRLPATGNETVLDAISLIDGIGEVSSKRMWVARPAPAGQGCAQVMDVDWRAITAEGKTATNYQLLPGDRIYVKADPLLTVDAFLSRVFSPVERVFGVTLLGNGLVRNLEGGTGVGGFGGGIGAGF